MLEVVIDSTVFVSALLTRGGVAAQLIQHAKDGVFLCYLAEEILAEIQRVLHYPELLERYRYTAQDIQEFCQVLRETAALVTDLPQLAIVRDPNDDMIVACAVVAQASYIVSRDKDLLSLGEYESIVIVTPETFMGILREQGLI